VLFISTRRDGRSLGEMAKQELGTFAGIVVMLGALGVMIIILAVLALVVVKALAHSPGVYSVLLQPFQLHCSWAFTCVLSVRENCRSFIIGFVLMMMAIVYGGMLHSIHIGGHFSL
jgi:carbon starvation protein